jgi:hypothetical protein
MNETQRQQPIASERRLESLFTQNFRTFTAMYVGSRDFTQVGTWVEGYDKAMQVAFPDEVSDLHGFREWLILRAGGGDRRYAWSGLIRQEYGQGPEATARFFELFDAFRADVNSKGLAAVFKLYHEYEIDRYGAPSTSRYYAEGWNKS